MPPDNDDFGNPETDLGYSTMLCKMAMEYADTHLQTARRMEIESGGIYITHSPNDTPYEDTLAVMLTRDGETPEFEEDKEILYLYFPVIEGLEGHPPMIWVQHINKGKSHTYTLTEESMEPTDLDFSSEGISKKIKKSVSQVARTSRKRTRQAHKRAHRYRDLIHHLRLTPQRYNPNS